MVLPLGASQLLERPAPRLLLELHLGGSSWPLTLTDHVLSSAAYGAGPELVSTVDTYAPFMRARKKSWEQEVVALDPWAWWRFDDLTGQTQERMGRTPLTATTFAGNVNNGVVRGVAGMLVGDNNRCFTFDGTDDNVNLANAEDESSLDITNGSATVLMLVRTTVASGVRAMIRRGAGGTPSAGYALEYDRPNSRLRATLNATQFNSSTLPVTLHDGNPHLVAAVIDRARQQLIFYVDGIEVSRHDISAITTLTVGQVTIVSGSLITGSSRWQGDIDEVMLFHKALSPEDVVNLHRTRKWLVESLFEGRLVGAPQLGFSAPSMFGGLSERIDTITFRLANHDGRFNRLFWEEPRGKLVVGHWYDARTGELQEEAFLGQLAAPRAEGWIMDCTATSMDRARQDDMVPRSFIKPQQFQTAPDQGLVLPYTFGIDRRVPARYVKAKRVRVQLAGPMAAPAVAAGSAGALTGTFKYRVRYKSTATGLRSPDGPESPQVTVSAQRVMLSDLPVSADGQVDKKIIERHIGGGRWVEVGEAPNFSPDFEDNATGLLRVVTSPGTDPDEYDYIPCKGNAAIVRVWTGDRRALAGEDYEILPRGYWIDGRPCTTVRFRRAQVSALGGAQVVPVTMDVQRVYRDCDKGTYAEWQWFNGFQEFVTGFHATPGTQLGSVSTITEAALRSGPTQVDLGAVAFNGIDDYLEVAALPFQRQTFTLESWFLVDPACPNTVFWKGPNTAWNLSFFPFYFANGPYCDFRYFDWSGTAQNFETAVGGSLPAGQLYGIDDPLIPERWNWVAITVKAPSALGVNDGVISFYINGYLAATKTHTGIRMLDPALAPSPMAFGTSGFGGNFFRGALGYCRFDRVVRSERDLLQGYWMMKRNPAAFMREFYERELELGVDSDSAALATLIQNSTPVANAGHMRCDGSITERVPVREVIEQFTRFRGLRPEATTSGLVKFVMPEPPAESTAGFSTGAPYTNVIGGSRVRASLSEAINIQPIEYRLLRDSQGQSAGYQHVLEPFITPVGKRADPMQLPLVRSSKTADIIRDWFQRNLRRADEGLSLVVQHEARALRRGSVVRVLEPALGISDPADYEVVAMRRTLSEYELALIPFDSEALTVYEPEAVPPEEAAEREVEPLDMTDVGLDFDDNPADERITTITPRVQRPAVMLPNGRGSYSLSGGAAPDAVHEGAVVTLPPDADAIAWRVMDDGDIGSGSGVADDDQTRLVLTGLKLGTRRFSVRIGPTPASTGHTTRIIVRAFLMTRAVDTVDLNVLLAPLIVMNGTTYVAGTPEAITPDYSLIQRTWTLNPATGAPWTLAEAQSITEMGLEATPGPGEATPSAVNITAMALHVIFTLDSPEGISHWRLWKLGVNTVLGIDFHPDPPTRADDSYRVGVAVGPISDGPDTPGLKYDYYMGLYDIMDRQVALIGPSMRTVQG